MPFSIIFMCLLLFQYLTICSANGEGIEISKLISQKGTSKLNEIKRRPMAKIEEESMPSGIDLGRLPFKMPKGIEPKNVRRCQFNNGTLWASATECEDDLESESCLNIFGKGEPRPPICLNSELSDLAKRCAKSCRLCCERPKFNCIDSGSNLMDCRAHQAKCNEPSWRKIMMAVCEQTCGFCSTEKCFDSATDCPSLRSLCFDRPISPLFRQQCPLTCGLCQPGEGREGKEEEEMNNQKTPKELIVLVRKKNGKKCEDLSPSCGENVKLCNDENYSQLLEEKCAKTCGHCQKEEEEEEIAVKRIRHGKRKEGRIMERPMAKTNDERQKMNRKNGPIIVIDNRKMVQKRAGRKERMKMRQNGMEMVQISREVQSDQGEKIGQFISPIIVMIGGEKEEEEMGTISESFEEIDEKEEEKMENGRNSTEIPTIERNGTMMKIVETILTTKKDQMNEGKREKRNTNTKVGNEEEMVDELLETNEEKGEEENSQKEPEIEEDEEEEEEETQDDEEEEEKEEEEESEEADEQVEEMDDEFEGILEILKEKLGNEEQFKEDEVEDEEDDEDDEDEEENDSIKEEGFNDEFEEKQSRLENDEKLEEELAMAGIKPDIKKSGEMQMGREKGGRRKPKIIRVRIRPSGKRRKNMKNEELEKFDGILRDRQGKALKIEEMKGGIGKALEEIKEKYGIEGGNEKDGKGNGNELLVEMGKEMKEELLAILGELRKIRKTNKILAIEQIEKEKKGRKKRKNEEEEEKNKEENDDGKRMLNVLGKILKMATTNEQEQKKPTKIKEEEELGSMDKLVEMLRKRMAKNEENEEISRKRKVNKQKLALIDDGEGTKPVRLVQFVKMPGQKLATIPTQIVLGGSRLLNGPISVDQPKQPQMIISAQIQQPQQPPPTVLLPQPQPIPQPNNMFQSPQQIVQQPQQGSPIPQQQPIASNNMNNILPSAAVQSPQPSVPLPQPRPPPQFVIQRPISSPREIILVQPARPRRPFSLLRNPTIGIGTRNQQNGIGGGAICRDYYPYCEQIVPHGFCNSEFYPLRMKREFCPQSCNLC